MTGWAGRLATDGLAVRSLRARLALLFLAWFSTMMALGVASIWSLDHSIEVSIDVRDRWLPNSRLLGDLNNSTSDYRTAEANSMVAASAEERQGIEREIAGLGEDVARAQTAYEAIPHSADEVRLYRQFSATWTAYKAVASQVTALATAGRGAEAAVLYRTRSRTVYDTASDLLGQLTSTNTLLAAKASERSAAAYGQARWILGAALLAAGLMLAVVIAQVRRTVSNPLLELGRAMRRLAANDTGLTIAHTGRADEIGEMARAMLVFRANAIELMQSQRGLAQQAGMLEEKLAHEQAVSQMQRNFVTMVTHEFRTPLTHIDAQAQRLANLKDRLQPADVDERATRIRAAVKRIILMIDHLVESSRLMDGETSLFFHPAEIDLAPVLREICETHRQIFPAAEIEARLPQALVLQADPKLLFQALSNLVSNAIKYSPRRPRIAIRATCDDRCITVSVEDRGIGIPPGDRPHVFERYFRGSNVDGYVGTGIGLFLVATVVRLHGGTISCDSEPGSGSVFTVTLPVRQNAGQTAAVSELLTQSSR